MKNAVLINAVKVISFILGFFGALSLMRSLSSAFSWYAYIIYGNWFHFGPGLSILSLALCLGLFTYSIWHTKPSNVNPPHRRIDYSLLALACGTGFYAVVHILQNWAGLLGLTMQTAIIVFPIIAYILPMLALWELLIRLHDKTLMPTLYWLAFFKTYPAWQPIGFFAALLLASQLFILIYRFFTLAGWFSFFTVGVITYFAAFLLNLSKEYDKANAEKIQAERFKSELITNVSHDIKTPLTSIINYVDLLKREHIQGKAVGYIHVLDKKSARLKTLIDDLMEASKAGTGNVRVELQEINLSEIIGQVAGEFEDNFADKNLELIIRQPEAPILFNTDNRHLYRVLENLFSNASKYALGGTRVFVEVSVNDNKPHIIMQNTSASPINLSDGEATAQFIRGDKSRQTEGSGLGLYIAKSLVEVMGGELSISISGDLFRVDIFLQ